MRNPFRAAIMRAQFDGLVRAYDTKHRDLITADGLRNRGNGAAGPFWLGYDGLARERWNAASRKMIAWACYRAGEAVRQREEAAGRPLIVK